MNKKIKNILVIRSDRIGEFILTLPAMHSLKKKFPASRLIVMASPYSCQLIAGNPDVDGIIEYEDSNFATFSSICSLIFRLKKFALDLVVIFNPKRKFNIVTFLAGIPIRVGYYRKWGFLLNRRIPDLKYLGAKHEVEYNFDLVKLIGADSEEKVFPVVGVEEKDSFAEEFLCKAGLTNAPDLVTIHPWASNPVKEWPLASFIALTRRLIDELNLKIVIIGGKESKESSEYFVKELGREVVNLAGQTTLRQLITILSNVKLLVTNDSGPMHVAASLKTTVLALFRKEPPGVSAKRWGPVGNNHIVIENKIIGDISIEEVFDGVKKILQR